MRISEITDDPILRIAGQQLRHHPAYADYARAGGVSTKLGVKLMYDFKIGLVKLDERTGEYESCALRQTDTGSEWVISRASSPRRAIALTALKLIYGEELPNV